MPRSQETSTPRRPRGRPAGVSREAVLDGALGLLDEVGLDAFSMRTLGGRLNVDPMTIYRHFPSRTALLDGVVERVFAEMPIAAETSDWREDAAACLRALRTTLLAHPEAVPLIAMRPPVTPGAFDATEALLRALEPAGLSPRETLDAAQILARTTVGHVVAQAGPPPGADRDGRETAHAQSAATLPADRFPRLARAYAEGYEIDHDRLFERSVTAMLDEIGARAATAPAEPDRAEASSAQVSARPPSGAR
ncbi:TetR/AcrR family transcriptional regulator C-terminal domain-containing protein [Microbacterium sp. 179-I 3D3 NHS]|uniref:TetR/AcrR family transcriptional regulator C-terminal domain-containing protein n=1 Tax=unclassified Microbacterium TaxID=2609290 RepID=UPI0039A3358A